MAQMDGLCVSAVYHRPPGAPSGVARLVFYARDHDPGWALDVSFLVTQGAAGAGGASGVVGRWGDPLRLGAAGGARSPRDYYWSWADVEAELRRQQAAASGCE